MGAQAADVKKIHRIGVAGAGCLGDGAGAAGRPGRPAGHDLWANRAALAGSTQTNAAARQSNGRFLPGRPLLPADRSPVAESMVPCMACDALLLAVPGAGVARSRAAAMGGLRVPGRHLRGGHGNARRACWMVNGVARAAHCRGAAFGAPVGAGVCSMRLAQGLPCAVTIAFEVPADRVGAVRGAGWRPPGSSLMRRPTSTASRRDRRRRQERAGDRLRRRRGTGLGRKRARRRRVRRGFAEMARFGQALGGRGWRR
jgi:glycerol-3-phosphate dehydrogenase